MRLFDDYDWAAVVAVVAVTFLGVLATGAWLLSFLLAAVLCNGAAYLLRRRANSNDRPVPGRMRARQRDADLPPSPHTARDPPP